MKKLITICLAVTMILAVSGAAQAGYAYDQDVTPDVIFGDGNANGSFTVNDDAATSNIELGLRAKLRFDATGQPDNIFNSNGDGTYTFVAGAPTGGAGWKGWRRSAWPSSASGPSRPSTSGCGRGWRRWT